MFDVILVNKMIYNRFEKKEKKKREVESNKDHDVK